MIAPRVKDTETATAMVTIEPIALRAKDAAVLLSMSERTFRKLHAAGLVPMPIMCGRSHRWSTDELRKWVAARCPTRAAWTRSNQGAGITQP